MPPKDNRDFLIHLESYLAKRDGVDKLLKLSRYAAKIILSSDTVPATHPFHQRLTTFESNVGLSRKAFRLGKFIQDVNSLRSAIATAKVDTKQDGNINISININIILALAAYGGEGLYYFIEQFVWLSKSGLLDSKQTRKLQRVSVCAELVGYVGSIGLKVIELNVIAKEEACLLSTIEIAVTRGDSVGSVEGKLKKLREKKLMKRLSLVQDVADGWMAVADVSGGKGPLSGPLLLACAGMVSGVISTHKNWLSC